MAEQVRMFVCMHCNLKEPNKTKLDQIYVLICTQLEEVQEASHVS